MTEQEWLMSDNPQAMLAELETEHQQLQWNGGKRISDRKLRLYTCAVVRQVWHLLDDDSPCGRCYRFEFGSPTPNSACPDCKGSGRINRTRNAVEVAERMAEETASNEEVTAARNKMDEVLHNRMHFMAKNPPQVYEWMGRYILLGASQAADNISRCNVTVPGKVQADILRDIVGNPFSKLPYRLEGRKEGLSLVEVRTGKLQDGRPYEETQGVKWFTPTVVSLTQAAYDERSGQMCDVCDGARGVREHRAGEVRGSVCSWCQDSGYIDNGTLDPDRLLVLSDALEEAGCQDVEILNHLRNPDNIHVRGCWVLDLILGKS